MFGFGKRASRGAAADGGSVRIDVRGLRDALEDATGAAAFGASPLAEIDLFEIEAASPDELVRMAEDYGVDWHRFIVR